MGNTEERKIRNLLSRSETRTKGFELLVRTYGERLYWQIRRMVLIHEDADDILQNVFIKAWTHLDDFRHDSKLHTWLYRIAINECLDHIRRGKTALKFNADIAENDIAKTLIADKYFDGDKTDAMLKEAIARLPNVQRTVFMMKYYDEMKFKDISKILETSEGALKASYHIAVKKIVEYFKMHD